MSEDQRYNVEKMLLWAVARMAACKRYLEATPDNVFHHDKIVEHRTELEVLESVARLIHG